MNGTVTFQNRPDGYVVQVEGGGAFFQPHPVSNVGDLPPVVSFRDGPLDYAVVTERFNGDTVVQRDVWVISKQPSVVAEALAAQLG